MSASHAVSLHSLPIHRVRLQKGPFKVLQNIHGNFLDSVEPGRLLARCRRQVGLSLRGEGYGGRESRDISSHSLGRYPYVLCFFHAVTGRPGFLELPPTNKPDDFFEEAYRLPRGLTQGLTQVVVRFQSRSGDMAGGVFGVRAMLASAAPAKGFDVSQIVFKDHSGVSGPK